ncbi:MAG: hypothetical protein MUQ10_09625 [Anaerolineae bacterium]|nr:hypothetical protein [Anaerolineae bacterium]
MKADSYTCRVLFRLGVLADESPDPAIAAARRLHRAYPGDLDGVLWVVGRTWCHPGGPECQACPLAGVCSYATASISLATDTGILTAG